MRTFHQVKQLKILGLIILPLLAACSHTRPSSTENIYVQDLNGVRSRAAANLDSVRAGKTTIETPSSLPDVKIISRTSEMLVFEATGVGLATKHERPLDAENRAEEDALSKAVKAAGVNVYSGMQDVITQYGNTSYQFIGKYLNVWSNALVSHRKVAPASCNLDQDGTTRCTTKIAGEVYFKGDPDPNFELKTSLGKPAYFEGDKISLSTRLSKDAYITVLNCDEDGNVTVLYPNRQVRDNFLQADKDLVIPDERFFELKALLPLDRQGTSEMLHVIATKNQPLVTLASLKEENAGNFLRYSLGGVKDLLTKLAKLNRSDWTSQVLVYEIKKK